MVRREYRLGDRRVWRAGATSMRCLAVAAVFLIGALPAIAQGSAQYRACNDKAKSQDDMNACASEEAARVDAELKVVYSKLLLKAAIQPEAVAKIKASERAWIAYRDAYMEAMYPAKDKQAEYGSVYPMEADRLKAELTRQHVASVEAMLRKYDDR